MNIGEPAKHPSFGLVQLSRVQQGTRGRALFDSPFRHNHYITMRVHRATKSRTGLHTDHIMPAEMLVEIALSEAQFARMVTSPNMGLGTPCTILWAGEPQPECPADETKKTFIRETEEEFAALTERMRVLEKMVGDMTKKERMNAADKEALRSAAFEARRVLDDHLPFLQKEFTSAMDKIVQQAKTEVEAHVSLVAQRVGLENVKREDLPMLETDAK